MSAYLCSDTHTCVLALWFARERDAAPSTALVTAVAQNLRYLNSHALHCLYGDEPQPLPDDIFPALARATAWLEAASAADIHGAARGFRYQCAEGNAPELPEWQVIEYICARAENEARGAKSDVWAIDDDTPPPKAPQPTPGPDQRQAKKAARAAVAAALVAANPRLVPVSAVKGGALVAAAKNCRAELKAAFPGVKFSVKTSRFSGGDSMDVRWIDGPTSDQVAPIVDKYAAGSFNGMDDSYTYHDSAWRDAFGDAKYTDTSRDYSDAAIASAIRTVCAKYAGNFAEKGMQAPTVEEYKAGKLWNVQLIDGANLHHDGLQSIISRELHRRTWCLTRSVKTETEEV